MPKFPKPVGIPKEVEIERKDRLKQLVISSLFGIILRLSIVCAELVGVYIFSSAALLMDALASLVDLFSSVLLIVCIKLAARPPDANHPFGHGRFEPLMGLLLGLFMAFVGVSMLIKQAIAVFSVGEMHVIHSKVWLIPFFAMILLEVGYQIVFRVAKKQNSSALAADALHYRIDALSSFCAALALFIAGYIPSLSELIDYLGAIVISIFMIVIGCKAAWENIKPLLDVKPDFHFFTLVKKAANRVPGVLGTEKINIQLYGPDAHVDIDVEVDPHMTVEVAHKISQKVRVEIQKEWPTVQDVTVHIEPYYPNDH